MKVKSNYVKLSLIALGIAGLFTSVNTNAFFTMGQTWCNDGTFPNCNLNTNKLQYRNHAVSTNYSDYNSFNYYRYNTSTRGGAFYTLNTGDHISNGFLKSYNDGDQLNIGIYLYNSSYNFVTKTTYNFVKMSKDGTSPLFSVWDDTLKLYRTYGVNSLPNISNGPYTDSFEYFTPRHGSFVFYNAGYKSGFNTVQFIGDQVLYNRVIYVDTMDNSQNVWLIDFDSMKAWSLYEEDVDLLSSWLFGVFPFKDSKLEEYNWQLTYDVTLNEGGNSFFPLTAGNRVCPYSSDVTSDGTSQMGIQSCSRYNIGLSYSSTVFEKPNFGSGSSSGSGNTYDPGIQTYEQCRDQVSVVKNIAANEYACRNTIDPNCECEWGNCSCFSSGDFQQLYNFLRTYEGSGQYIGNLNTSCSIWYNKTIQLYSGSWSGSYANKFLTANSWSDDPNSIQISDYCGSYPSASSEQGRTCQYLGIGCIDFSIEGVVEAIGDHLTPLFGEYIDKYKNAYLSGYNYLDPSPICSSEIYGKSYSWGNYAVIFVAGRLIFVIYSVFKD